MMIINDSDNFDQTVHWQRKKTFTVKAIEENEPDLLCGATAADEKVSI